MKKDTLPKVSGAQSEFVERRQERDWLVRSVSIISVIGWIFAAAAFVIIDEARPEFENFFSRILHLRVRDYWDIALLRMSLGVLLVSFFTCVTGFFVNASRHRRKTDRFNKSLIVLGAITFILIVYLLTKLL